MRNVAWLFDNLRTACGGAARPTFVGLAIAIAACGGSQQHESAIVQTGSDESTTCCCKTTPETDDKDIVPKYAKAGRMECSTDQGRCVDDVQCSGQPDPAQAAQPSNPDTGVPPPPTLGGDSSGQGQAIP